jgi:Gly-Xaa carboxypeptidase
VNNHRGPQGASNISAFLLDRYGRDSLEFIIDEGGSEVKNIYGATFALPGTAEKGYFDVKVTVSGKGGHSSVPPEHTTIGQLSKVIELIENNPWEPVLTRSSRTSPLP